MACQDDARPFDSIVGIIVGDAQQSRLDRDACYYEKQ